MSSETDINREPIELVEIVLPRINRNYPDIGLTPDLIRGNGETILESEITRTADLFAGFQVRFGVTPSGIIWEQGSSTNGVYLGVDSGNLIFEVLSTNTGSISVDASQFSGKTIYVYVEIDFVASGSTEINLWAFDPVELTLTLLGTDTFTAGTAWADTESGAIGTLATSAPGGYVTTDWVGGISVANFYDSSAAPADMTDTFKQSLWLGRGVLGEPTDEQYILPCLQDLGTLGTRINVGAADDDYQPLGRRATLDFTCSDFVHSDIAQDPGFSSTPNTSTFWRKWLRRQKFGKVGALVKVYTGYANQKISQYEVRAYILDKVTYNEDGVSFHCRDVLSRTEFRKAQVPAPSTGLLNAALTDAAVTLDITGDVTPDYPASGTVRINDEIMTYTSRSYSDPVTTFSGLTRGTDGSTAAAHEVDDLVQLCRRYTSQQISTVVEELLFDDAQLEGQFVNLDEIQQEVAAYLDAYNLTTLITEPTAVDILLGQMSEECSFYLWWDERVQKVRLLAIRAVSNADIAARFTLEENIIRGTMKITEKPKQRLNVITCYYNPNDWTEDLEQAANFANALKVVNGTTSLPEQYGNLIQSREIFSRWLTTEAEVNQTTSRIALRYADVPEFAEFYVDAKDRAVWVGDVLTISHPIIVDENGDRVVKRWLIMEAEEIDPGHIVRYICADITLDGLIYLITENSVTTYSAELFAEGNAFITDNDGLNPDGTVGATIS